MRRSSAILNDYKKIQLRLDDIDNTLWEINSYMATWQDVKDAVAASDASWDATMAKLADLKDKLDNMPAGPSPEEFDAIVADMKAHTASVEDSMNEAPVVPVETPPEVTPDA